MTKTVTPLIFGVVIGVLATVWVAGSGKSGIVRQTAAPALTARTEVPADFSTASQDSANASAQDGIDALASINRPAELRAAALALLDEIGRDMDAISNIAAALPAADRLNFTFDAIASSAAEDPAGAIALALQLDDVPARTEALKRVARVLGGLDPYLALEHGRSINNAEVRDIYRNAVLREWAHNDADGFLGFVREVPAAEVRGAVDAFEAAAASRPEAVLELLDELPLAVRVTAEVAALDFLVRSDIDAARAHIDSMPFGPGSESVIVSAARSYASHDMEGALAWIGSLEPPSPFAATGVLSVLVQADPLRAVEQLIRDSSSSGGSSAGIDTFTVMRTLSSGPPGLMSTVADRFASVNDAAGATLFERFIEEWSAYDPETAYSWAVANPQDLTLVSARILARNLGRTSPALAQQAADWIPSELQDTWILEVTGEMARANFDNALAWIARYDGQPVYEEALASAMRSLNDGVTLENPNTLAQFLERQSATVRADSVAAVANIWAAQDPAAAANWAERVELAEADESRRQAAFSNIGRRWAERDAAGAERWVLDLAEGEARDRALSAVLEETARSGRIDPRLIEAFSSQSSVQQALVTSMCGLGGSDADLGRELIDTHITNPEQRAQAEQRLIQGIVDHFGCAGFGAVSFR